jgi:hypothetical protein
MEIGEFVFVVLADAASIDCPFEHEAMEHNQASGMTRAEAREALRASRFDYSSTAK